MTRFELALAMGNVLNQMEERGVLVDMFYLANSFDELQGYKNPLMLSLQEELGGINLNSPKQLLAALHLKDIRPEWKGKPSTDKRGLMQLKKNDIVDKLLKYSELDTLINTFVVPLRERGPVLHPSFSQTATRTGRLACYKPNLQQIPSRGEYALLVKNAFVARPNKIFLEADLGQIEPRLLAHFSGCENLCELFNDGIDFHQFTAERLGIDRFAAKTLNLSVGYLATEYSVSRQLNCGLEEAKEHINAWWRLFPDLRMWEYAFIEVTKQKGYLETLLGMRIPVDELDSFNSYRRGNAERQVINNLAQGSAQEIMQLGMLELDKQGFHILLQVHDSVLLEEVYKGDTQKQTVSDILCNVYQLRVPLTATVKVGHRWGELN